MHREIPCLLSVCFAAAALGAQAPHVVSTSPGANRSNGPFDPIVVTFASPLAPATVNTNSVRAFGRYTGVVPGTVTLDAAGLVVRFQPAVPLLVGDAVTITLARTITSAAAVPLAGGHQLQFWVASAPGSGQFQQTQTYSFRQVGEGSISTYGIHAGDIDRDGVPDMTAINEIAHDLRVYRSDGCGGFGAVGIVSDSGNWPSPQDSADFNHDGWMDLVTGDYLYGNVSVFMNNGAGSYLPSYSMPSGAYVRGIATGDFNGDGFHDIVAGNFAATSVWINNGLGGFLPPTTTSLTMTELNVVDANEDGHLDIVGCSLSPGNNLVLLGNGDGTFTGTPASVPIGGQPFASAVADLNGDGHIDIAYACLNPDSFRWLFGDGAGNFTFGGAMVADSWPTSIHLGDVDGDGDQDAVLSHYTGSSFYLYLNQGNGTFAAPMVFPSPGGASCATIADFDRDGDLDILGADEITDQGILFTQVGPTVGGAQSASCAAALRLDQRAGGAGYGGTPAVPVRVGGRLAVSVSGQPGDLAFVAAGGPLDPGLPLFQWGLLGLDPTVGLIAVGAVPLDANGEALFAVAMPPAPVGGSVAMQSLVFTASGEVLSNPVRCVLVP